MKISWLKTVGVVVAITGSCMAMLALASPHTSAIDLFGKACQGAGSSSAACGADGKNTLTGPGGIILKAANIMATISGIVAVFIIMLAGFVMITAAGDSSKVSTARKTIVYTIVGLIVIVLARTIVFFVLSRVGAE
jgi:hypothetical protein